ncbi:MAG: ATP-binding protein [Planctomycetaceae bacterium]|nr:ATP-binding protein [Planctomycetaceae bacterium]
MHQTDQFDRGLFPTKDQLGLHNEYELVQKALQWGRIEFWVWDIPTNQFHMSDTGLFERLGYVETEYTPFSLEKLTDLFHPDDVRIAGKILAGEVSNYESTYRIRAASGEYVSLYVLGRVTVRDSEGKPLQVGGIARDVTQLTEAENSIRNRDRLLSAANEAARLLLHTSTQGFDLTIWRVLHLVGAAAQVNRVHIWKNFNDSSGHHGVTQIYEWTNDTAPRRDESWSPDVAYDKIFPTWYETIANGQCISNIVRLMSPTEQNYLSSQGVVSILVAPIQLNGKPWGVICFSDCFKERYWSEVEEGVLKAVGMLIATAINRQEIEAALEAERVMLNHIFETSPVSLAITTNGIVQRCNQRFTDHLGIKVGQAVQPYYAAPNLRDEIIGEVCSKGNIIGRNIQYLGKDGNILEAIATYQPIIYGGKPSILCWAVDVTDLKTTEKSLMAAKNLAEEATRVKSEFLSRMSHELRTPMTAIMGMIQLCHQTGLTDQQREYLNTALTASNELLGIIENILDFSKLETGEFEVENVSFNLNRVMEAIMGIMEGKAKEKNLLLKLEIDEDIPVPLTGSPTHLKQVLDNLISNAIKFTEQGGVTVTVRRDDSDELANGQTRLLFSIRDTGIGMTTEQIGKLFESFSQADTSMARKYTGIGLGMSFSKHLVELMGGDIKVVSEPGLGTTIRFTATFFKWEIKNEK